MSLAQACRAMVVAGLNVLPAHPKDKRPLAGDWTKYRERPMDADEAVARVEEAGAVGIITGNGIECIDFDLAGAAWPEWRRRVLDADPDALDNVYVERSQSGGYHVVYRCQEISGSRKLTTWVCQAHKVGQKSLTRFGREIAIEVFAGDNAALSWRLVGKRKAYKVNSFGMAELIPIETRGDGGFLVVAPSPGYTPVAGSLEDMGEVTVEQRELFLRSAVEMSDGDIEGRAEGEGHVNVKDEATRIGEWYSTNGDHVELLEGEGWTLKREHRGREEWVRPGKAAKEGLSGTWTPETRLFHVFTTSDPKLPCSDGGNGDYTLFKLYTYLKFNRDFSKAAKALRKEYPEAAAEIKNQNIVALTDRMGTEVTAKVRSDLDNQPMQSVPPDYLRVVVAVREHMARGGLAFNALGGLTVDGSINSKTGISLANDVYHTLKLSNPEVSYADVCRRVEKVQEKDSMARRASIVESMCGLERLEEGEAELRKLMVAITGECCEADYQALRHLMWNAKAKAMGGGGCDHHCVVFTNVTNGGGKSVMVRKLMAPWQELAEGKLEVKAIVDEKRTKILGDLILANLDEMSGMEKADLDEFKSKITAETCTYRPMRTNESCQVRVNCSFFGTSNKPVSMLVRDTTGNRRFYQIETLPKLDWDTINGINYDLVWRAVDERETAPGVQHREVIKKKRETQRWDNTVVEWVMYEDANQWSAGTEFGTLDVTEPVATRELYKRYCGWCVSNGEKPEWINGMVLTLMARGWKQVRTMHGRFLVRNPVA